MTEVVTTSTTSTVVVNSPTSATVNVTGSDSTLVVGPGVIEVTSPIANAGTMQSAHLSLDPAFGGFYDTTTQSLVAVGTPQQARIGFTAYGKNVTRTNSGDITATVAGNYSFTYTALFANNASQISYASLFVKFNDATVPGTSTLITIPAKHGGVKGYASGGNTFIVPMAVGDKIQLFWDASSTNVSIHYVPEAGTVPAADSVLLSIRQIGSL